MEVGKQQRFAGLPTVACVLELCDGGTLLPCAAALPSFQHLPSGILALITLK
jgi:hypothetical protein